MIWVLEEEDTKAMILMDALNAFNCLNREVALHNSEVICPTLAPILINTYQQIEEFLPFNFLMHLLFTFIMTHEILLATKIKVHHYP